MNDEKNLKENTSSDLQKRLAHIGRLSAGIGHNIMTPLSLIMMNSDLLAMKLKDSDTLQASLKEIAKQATLISKIAETMMWKVKTEEQEIPSFIQVGSLVRDNLEFWMGDMFFKHKLEKTFHINPQTPPIKAVPYLFTSFVDEWISSIIERAKPLNKGKLTIEVDSPSENQFYIQFEDSLPFKEYRAIFTSDHAMDTTFPALRRLITHLPAELDVSVSPEGGLRLRLTWLLP